MIDYFAANLWQFWSLVVIVCLILELTSGDFFILCFSIGALVTAVFAAFGVSIHTIGMFKGALMIGGVFIGAATWWFLLTFMVSLLRRKFRPRHLLWINRISGTVIVLLGAAAVLLMFVNTPVNGILK